MPTASPATPLGATAPGVGHLPQQRPPAQGEGRAIPPPPPTTPRPG
jgi:hypothetical protein